MDQGGIKRRVAEFDAQHGASVAEDGWILFEDGAAREANPMGALVDPPTKPWELAKRVLHYRDVCLKQAVAEFSQRKTYLLKAAAHNLKERLCGPPPADIAEAEAGLKQMQAKVRKCQKAYDAALKAVEDARPERLRQFLERDATNRSANQALIDRIDKIEV